MQRVRTMQFQMLLGSKCYMSILENCIKAKAKWQKMTILQQSLHYYSAKKGMTVLQQSLIL